MSPTIVPHRPEPSTENSRRKNCRHVNVCVGTLINGGITVISPHDGSMRHIPVDDRLVTNICFGDSDGSGEYRDAYITGSSTGRLFHMRWHTRGLRLHWQ